MAIQTADKTNFKELIGEDFVIADFYGTTCVPCKLFSKILEDIAAEIPFLNIVKLNTPRTRKLRRSTASPLYPPSISTRTGSWWTATWASCSPRR